jgi:hypothetical protein
MYWHAAAAAAAAAAATNIPSWQLLTPRREASDNTPAFASDPQRTPNHSQVCKQVPWWHWQPYAGSSPLHIRRLLLQPPQ